MKISAICTGNICRSPIAEVILRALISDDPLLDGHVEVTSAGTARWHVGSPMDQRSQRALQRAGYRDEGTLGDFADFSYLDSHDLVLVMTREHVREIRDRHAGIEIVLLRSLLGAELDVPDPYYGDDDEFDECLRLIERGCREMIPLLRERVRAEQLAAGSNSRETPTLPRE